MIWYIAAAICFGASLALLIFNYVRDKRYEKKRTSEAMRPEVWEEIAEESDQIQERKKRFEAALAAAKNRPPTRT